MLEEVINLKTKVGNHERSIWSRTKIDLLETKIRQNKDVEDTHSFADRYKMGKDIKVSYAIIVYYKIGKRQNIINKYSREFIVYDRSGLSESMKTAWHVRSFRLLILVPKGGIY